MMSKRKSNNSTSGPNLFHLGFLGFAIDNYNGLGKCVVTDIPYRRDPQAKQPKLTKQRRHTEQQSENSWEGRKSSLKPSPKRKPRHTQRTPPRERKKARDCLGGVERI